MSFVIMLPPKYSTSFPQLHSPTAQQPLPCLQAAFARTTSEVKAGTRKSVKFVSVHPADMICVRCVVVNTLHKGNEVVDDYDNEDDDTRYLNTKYRKYLF